MRKYTHLNGEKKATTRTKTEKYKKQAKHQAEPVKITTTQFKRGILYLDPFCWPDHSPLFGHSFWFTVCCWPMRFYNLFTILFMLYILFINVIFRFLTIATVPSFGLLSLTRKLFLAFVNRMVWLDFKLEQWEIQTLLEMECIILNENVIDDLFLNSNDTSEAF